MLSCCFPCCCEAEGEVDEFDLEWLDNALIDLEDYKFQLNASSVDMNLWN